MRMIALSIAVVMLFLCAACSSLSEREKRAGLGAAGGAAVGAGAGALAGHPGTGAVIGGLAGGAGGYYWDDIKGWVKKQ